MADSLPAAIDELLDFVHTLSEPPYLSAKMSPTRRLSKKEQDELKKLAKRAEELTQDAGLSRPLDLLPRCAGQEQRPWPAKVPAAQSDQSGDWFLIASELGPWEKTW